MFARARKLQAWDVDKEKNLKYRICLKTPDSLAIAVSDSEAEIKQHWEWIQKNLIISFDEDHVEAVHDHILAMIAGMAQEDEHLRKKQQGSKKEETTSELPDVTQKDIETFKATFGLENETLVTLFPCTVVRRPSAK